MITWSSCINQSDVYLATAITNAISDIFLILIPVKIAWNLHLRPIQKIGVFALFSMGALYVEFNSRPHLPCSENF
jgi:energy-converting hydrogenase Eha subunit C